MKKPMFDKLFWIDLEFTTLDMDRTELLEVAVIITDADFNEIENLDYVVHQPDPVLDEMKNIPLEPGAKDKPEFKGMNTVYDIHDKNGLIEASKQAELGPNEVEEKIIELVKKHFPNEKPMLAGNSIFYDRTATQKKMPRLYKMLHYRSVDVSSFKIIYLNQGVEPYQKKGTHRALDDIRESIAELKHYLNQ